MTTNNNNHPSESWRGKKTDDMTFDEHYFAVKDAYATLDGKELKARINELTTPNVIAQFRYITPPPPNTPIAPQAPPSTPDVSLDEVYFSVKNAFYTLEGEALKKRLTEIYTPQVQAQMDKLEKQLREEWTEQDKQDLLQLETLEDVKKYVALRLKKERLRKAEQRDQQRTRKYSPRTTRKT